MAYFMFIDESGQDHHDSPYEVLAGVVIRDHDLWNLIKGIQQLELKCFGRQYRDSRNEIKAKKFLKRKTFRLANQMPAIPLDERTALAKQALDDGASVTMKSLTALAQAKLDYVNCLIKLIGDFNTRIFASIVKDPSSLPKEDYMLRKDYVYLFERLFYFLEDNYKEQGVIVFDELDKSASHLVLDQMDKYFKKTKKGRIRSSLVIPEPFFVHSDLTTGIQIVDFVAYVLSWNFRSGGLNKPCRDELQNYVELIKPLRYRTFRTVGSKDYEIWSISIV